MFASIPAVACAVLARLAFITAACIALPTAPAALATIRTGSISYAPPEEPPESTDPPQTQAFEYTQSITSAYDDQAGVFSVHLAIYDAPTWSDTLPSTVLSFRARCNENLTASTVQADFYYSRDPGSDGDPPTVDTVALLTRSGSEDVIEGTVAPVADGFTVTYPATSDVAGIDLSCFGNVTDEDRLSDYVYFDGFAPLALSARTATGWFERSLASTYGTAWSDAGTSWALCPREEFFPMGTDRKSPAAAICMAEFNYNGRRRFVSARIDQTDTGPALGALVSRTWVRAWKQTSRTCRRQAHVKGTIASNDGTCPALMVGDLARGVRTRNPTHASLHGTNTAGFTTVTRYACRTRGRTITCTNVLGDAFRWTRPR